MKVFKLATIAVAGALTFAACKYEEGPKISFRAKRDRVANEWKVKAYTFNGEDHKYKLVDVETNFELIFNFYRQGAYGVEVVKKETDQDGNEKFITDHQYYPATKNYGFDGCCYDDYHRFLDSLPDHIQYIMAHGSWTFDKGHTKLQVKPELSYDDQEVMTQRNTIDWGIVMLREKEMKVKGRNENDVEWVLTLERVNPEPYFY